MFYISSSASPKDNIKEAVTELAQLGFLNIELSGGTKYYDGIENDLFSLKKKYKINFLVHNYFPPPPDKFVLNIASNEPQIRDRTFKFIANVVNLAKALGSGIYTVHPGFNKSSVIDKDGKLFYEKSEKAPQNDNTREDFYKGIDLLLNNIAKRQNFRIGVENFFPFKDLRSFMDSQADILEFLDHYKDEPNIGVLLDLGHLNVAADCLGFNKFDATEKIFTDYADKIFEIHMSENNGNGDFHQVSDLGSWQVELIRKNKRFLNGMPIVFEWRSVLDEQTYRSFEALKQLFNGS